MRNEGSEDGSLGSEEERKLDFSEREIALRADFNQLDDVGYVTTSLRFVMKGPRHPREGEWVFLLDDHGRGCLGCVEEVSGWMARVRPDWESWVPADDRPDRAPPAQA